MSARRIPRTLKRRDLRGASRERHDRSGLGIGPVAPEVPSHCGTSRPPKRCLGMAWIMVWRVDAPKQGGERKQEELCNILRRYRPVSMKQLVPTPDPLETDFRINGRPLLRAESWYDIEYDVSQARK